MNIFKTKKIKESFGDRAFLTFCYIFVIFIVVITFLPFWNLLVLSLCDRAEAAKTGFKLFTTNPVLTAYKQILSGKMIWISARNSIVRVILGTFISVGLTAMMAYPLSKKDFIFQKGFTVLVLFTMVFNGGLIPNYFLITGTLKLTDTIWAMVLPTAIGAYNLIIVRNFLRSIPASLEESARIDGAGEFTIWCKIVLPLSKPVLATVTLWKAVEHWNAYFDCLLYMRDQSKYVLQVLLRRVLIEQQLTMLDSSLLLDITMRPTEAATKAALIMIGTIPIVIVYPFLQKYFMSGIMLGGVKE